MSADLVLSLFPGGGLLDMAFEESGFCIVRGPDLLWGGDVKRFHPPAGKFDGVIGGPPCKWWSSASNIAKARGQRVQPDMIPEFARCVNEAQPRWFLMENVPRAPLPACPGFEVFALTLDATVCGADQRRIRRLCFGTRDGRLLEPDILALVPFPKHMAVTTRALRWDVLRQRPRSTNSLRTWADAVEAQGLPSDFLKGAPYTWKGRWEILGNGVPLPMGRVIAKAVKAATIFTADSHEHTGPVGQRTPNALNPESER